jgi:hypothetical protein
MRWPGEQRLKAQGGRPDDDARQPAAQCQCQLCDACCAPAAAPTPPFIPLSAARRCAHPPAPHPQHGGVHAGAHAARGVRGVARDHQQLQSITRSGGGRQRKALTSGAWKRAASGRGLLDWAGPLAARPSPCPPSSHLPPHEHPQLRHPAAHRHGRRRRGRWQQAQCEAASGVALRRSGSLGAQPVASGLCGEALGGLLQPLAHVQLCESERGWASWGSAWSAFVGWAGGARGDDSWQRQAAQALPSPPLRARPHLLSLARDAVQVAVRLKLLRACQEGAPVQAHGVIATTHACRAEQHHY